MSHAQFRRSDQAQRGRAAAARPGAVRRRRRASRHAACGLSAQQRRARPHPLDRRVGGARARGRRRRLYGGRPRRLLGAGAASGAAAADRRASIFNQRTQVPLAKDKVRHVGEPLAVVLAESRYLAEDALGRYRRRARAAAGGGRSGKGAARRHRPTRARRCARQHRRARPAEPRRLRGRAAPRADHIIARRFRYDHGASSPIETRGIVANWDARANQLTVWDTTQAPVFLRNGLAGMLGLERAAGARDRAVRRRRLRAEDHDVLSRGGGDPVGGEEAQPPGQVDRGPAGAFLRHHARARPDPRRRDRARARRPHPRHQGRVPARHRRLQSLRADGADQQPVHAARSLRGAELRQHLHRRLHQQADRHALSRRRPPARRVRDRAAARHRRARARSIDRAEIRRRNLIPPDAFPYNNEIIYQDFAPLEYDSGNYEPVLDKALDDDRLRRIPRRGAAAAARRKAATSASASPAMSKAPASGPTKAPRCRCRRTARSASRPASARRGRGISPASRRSSPTSSASTSPTSTSSPATPTSSIGAPARSRAAARWWPATP